MATTRQHHVRMKYLLAQLMLQEPDETFTTFTAKNAPTFLVRLWEHVGSELPTNERQPGTGLAVWSRPAKDMHSAAIVLTLPTPQARSEAWFVGAFRTSNHDIRVFCLEKGIDPASMSTTAVLAEIRADGRVHWGPLPDPRLESFVQAVDEIMNDPDSLPIAFTAMPIV